MALGDRIRDRTGLPSRRQILVGGGAGVGLLVAWALWPRAFAPNLVANPGETILNAFLKIGENGVVTVIVPQAELGQGVFTALPQILADELGADWRTIAVEAAPINPVYANRLLAGDLAEGRGPDFLKGALRWSAEEIATREALMITAGSNSVRAFEQPMREAGAAARVLLCKAAAMQWEADWLACDTAGGFVVRGAERLRFGALAAAATAFHLPDPLPLRNGRENRLTGRALPRLDLPSKVDGSANYAADIRLPDMAFASIRQGPVGDTQLVTFDRAAADAIPGVMGVVDTPHWVAAIAGNWWAADRALDAMRPKFETRGPWAESAAMDAALAAALEGEGIRIAAAGDLAQVFRNQTIHSASYAVGLAAHAPLETMCATARFRHDRLEVWLPTQAPGLARAHCAAALGIAGDAVTIHPMLAGGSFGRKLECEAAVQASVIAHKMNRPIQLMWSRAEDLAHDVFRPAARARMSAKLGAGGRIEGWLAKIAAPASAAEQAGRMLRGSAVASLLPDALGADRDAVAGALPAYAIPALAVDHHPAALGVPTGHWRSGAHSYTAFFTECFVDELAQASGVEPLSFRMQLLTDNPRLALCLSTAAALGGWEGGVPGSGQGIACHAMAGSHVAILAEAQIGEDRRIAVSRVVAAVDCGRIINPTLVRQQIEGGILYAIAAATGAPIDFARGLPVPRNFGDLAFPRLAQCPEITIELIRSNAAPGGVSEIAVPPVAPAIANALAANGRRLRALPLDTGAAR